MEKTKKSNIISGLIKWAIIIIVLIIVYFWKNEEINAAFREMRHFSIWVSILCLAATALHFVTEGWIIHDMTMYENRQMTWWEAFKCGLYCAFYKFISLGSLSGIAEVYYISKHDIDVGRASGITLVQYAYQKLGITILGVSSFILLYVGGISTVRDYAKWGVLGTLVALFIVTLLLLVSASKRIARMLGKLVNKLLGEKGILTKLMRKLPGKRDSEVKAYDKEIIEKIYTFNDAGRYFWQHKSLSVRVTLLKMLKMSLWYSIAGITVYAANPESVKFFIIPLLLMAVSNMIGTVMAAPAGAGTIEFVVSLLFAPLFGNTAATVAILYRFYSMVVPCLFGAAVFATDKRSKNKTGTLTDKAKETEKYESGDKNERNK